MAKTLYTEADVRALPRGAELVLGSGAVATPAALDLAYERGVRVSYGAPRAAAPQAGGGRGCLWGRMLAEDGTYVVCVQGGRAVVHRMTAAGPVELGRGGGCP